MFARRLALLLLALAPACNDGDDEAGGAAVDTCSTENTVDDIDDGITAAATGTTRETPSAEVRPSGADRQN